MSRRALLKGTITSMPAVLTLHSGAALARSSNLIRTSTTSHKDRYDRTLCLETDSVYRARGTHGRAYDLGEPAYGRVGAINERDYYLKTRRGVRRVHESEMCRRGGTYYYLEGDPSASHTLASADTSYGQNDAWQPVKVKRGVLVSATALSSFAGSIVYKDI